MGLRRREYAILELLALRKGSTLTKDMIMCRLYGGMEEREIKIVDVYVCKLRKKLSSAGGETYIETVWGQGYLMPVLEVDVLPGAKATPPPRTDRAAVQ